MESLTYLTELRLVAHVPDFLERALGNPLHIHVDAYKYLLPVRYVRYQPEKYKSIVISY